MRFQQVRDAMREVSPKDSRLSTSAMLIQLAEIAEKFTTERL
jgi:hypothetical protein